MRAPPSQWDDGEGLPERPAPRIPDAIEPITAYRVWAVEAGRRIRLLSIGRAHAWADSGVATAVCLPWPGLLPLRHRAPTEGCTCGIYAVRDIDTLFQLDPSLCTLIFGDPVPSQPNLIGEVQLSGKVIEHEDGYRAERARISAIFYAPSQQELAERVAGWFGVPALPLPTTRPPRSPATSRSIPRAPRMRVPRSYGRAALHPLTTVMVLAWLVCRLIGSVTPAVSPTLPTPTPSPSPTGVEAFAPGFHSEWDCLRGASNC